MGFAKQRPQILRCAGTLAHYFRARREPSHITLWLTLPPTLTPPLTPTLALTPSLTLPPTLPHYTVGNDPGVFAFGCVRIGTYRQAKQTNPRNHARADTASNARAPGPIVAATRQIAATVINT